ncbi:MAG: hypothetical protein ACOYK7_16505, partial [Pirellulales bacterium]
MTSRLTFRTAPSPTRQPMRVPESRRRRAGIPVALAVLTVVLGGGRGVAADPPLPGSPFAFDPLGAVGTNGPVRVFAAVEPAAEAGKPAVLAVTAALEPGWHLYAVDQAPGGPLATRIELAANSGWRVTGPFVPDSPAKKQAMGQGSVWKGLVIQEHSGRTTWRAPVVADKPGAASPSSPTSIRGSIRVQLCRDNSCTPPESYEFSAALPAATTPAAPPVTAAVPPAAAAKPARSGVDTAAIASRAAASKAAAPKPSGGPAAERAAPPAGPPAVAGDPLAIGTAGSAAAGQLLATHVPDKGHTAIEAAFAGNEAPWRLVVRLLPESGWHLYAPAATATTAVGQGKPTLLSATLPDGVRLESLRAVGVKPATQAELAAAGAVEGPVELEAVFAAEAAVPAGAQAELRIGFQTCSDTSCDPPQAIRLGVTLPPQAGGPGIEFSDVRYAEAARGAVAIAAAALVTTAETPAPGAGVPTLAAVPPAGGPELSAAEPMVAAPVAAVALSLPKALFLGLLGGL